jgi:hypothetical protein
MPAQLEPIGGKVEPFEDRSARIARQQRQQVVSGDGFGRAKLCAMGGIGHLSLLPTSEGGKPWSPVDQDGGLGIFILARRARKATPHLPANFGRGDLDSTRTPREGADTSKKKPRSQNRGKGPKSGPP